MIYVVALGILALVIYGIVKAATGNRYSTMSEEEFEAEAKRASLMGTALIGLQKIIDPGHRVEYVQEQEQRAESDSAESGDRPEPGLAQPQHRDR